ncbi:hypothetical protein GLOIN_2v1673269 [Rhizophagus irregularis DAOM 181602=DAOM 197198]|uniref:Uncharacterized protein n=1 Tax=Rhizophagus irregularis (strain DAOM 181602 / DAOM 197198 / MUCL 43194) TaxID=747089 RepID=A0A2P4PGY2_RHIID|nr:hypothetical protein GLOIN_2v1673269 [Rhizophagus irregularis DAOM 181602=DAOM 197198]POG64646.1 hypothetical protein GLOIN_2v1673269 [Rhizophagus irregularis DAOM 181602=DAOM 197198]|eukprot:XP_025171512.1 hypothetical protein GLOIN_2v1673269 [Rhizophagus irregularis DAOM 181602=DAOM 197198]
MILFFLIPVFFFFTHTFICHYSISNEIAWLYFLVDFLQDLFVLYSIYFVKLLGEIHLVGVSKNGKILIPGPKDLVLGPSLQIFKSTRSGPDPTKSFIPFSDGSFTNCELCFCWFF